MPPPHSAPEEDAPRVGDTTKRVVVFLFGALFGVLALVGAFQKEFGFAALLGIPALALFAIALRGRKKSVDAAHKASAVVHDLTYLP